MHSRNSPGRVKESAQVMTFDGWVDHLMRELLEVSLDDWFRVRTSVNAAALVPRYPGALLRSSHKVAAFIPQRGQLSSRRLVPGTPLHQPSTDAYQPAGRFAAPMV